MADLPRLLRTLKGLEVAPLVHSVNITTVLDAGAFLSDLGRMGGLLRQQIAASGRIVVNKADLVPAAMLRRVSEIAQGIAPAARVVPARFGLADETAALEYAGDAAPAHENGYEHSLVHANFGACGHDHDADQRHEVLGLTSWSTALLAPCDADGLQNVLEAVVSGRFGQVERVKGVVRSGAGWLRFDVAGGRPSMAAFAPNRKESGRVVAIGRQVDEERLRAAFKACAAA